MSAEQLKLLYKFAEHHSVSFSIREGVIDYSYFCSGTDCTECVLNYIDENHNTSCDVHPNSFTYEEIKQIRNDFPESLI